MIIDWQKKHSYARCSSRYFFSSSCFSTRQHSGAAIFSSLLAIAFVRLLFSQRQESPVPTDQEERGTSDGLCHVPYNSSRVCCGGTSASLADQFRRMTSKGLEAPLLFVADVRIYLFTIAAVEANRRLVWFQFRDEVRTLRGQVSWRLHSSDLGSGFVEFDLRRHWSVSTDFVSQYIVFFGSVKVLSDIIFLSSSDVLTVNTFYLNLVVTPL